LAKVIEEFVFKKNGCADNIKSILFHLKPAVLHANCTLLSDKDE